MSKEKLLSALDELDNYSENNSNNARTKKIRDELLMPKIKKLKTTFTKLKTQGIFIGKKSY